ncbi:spore coat protein [Spirochaetia bacterium]|nr:spore coat protein [Spirochaetia bacterium]
MGAENPPLTIPFALPFIGKEEEEAALRVLRSGWLTTGKEALAFEEEFAAFLGVTGEKNSLRCLAVNSATSGLHLALEAAGLGPGDLALVPAYTFTSTAEVVRYLGAETVFVDCAPGSFNMDPAALEKTLQRLEAGLPPYPRGSGEGFGPRGRPKAVLPVHFGGLPCDMDAIMTIARKYDLRVIEDAAHAFPSKIAPDTYAGTTGDAGVFSFYATKTITTGEGGMVVCRDPAMAERISRMRLHGIDRNVWNRYTDAKASWYYEVQDAGYKYNMPDILAAIGRVQLTRAVDLLRQREEMAKCYDEAFSDEPALILPPSGSGDARHLYPLSLRQDRLKISRDVFIEKMKAEGIGVSVHFIPLHVMPYYKNRYGFVDDDFPQALRNFKGEISLPLWPGMGEDKIERVIAVVKTILRNYTIL